MRILILFLSLILVSFQQTSKNKPVRVYFAQDSSEILAVNPIDKKTKSVKVLNDFAVKFKADLGGIKLKVCTNFDEADIKKLENDRFNSVVDALVKLGVPENFIVRYWPSQNFDQTVHKKKVIEAEKSMSKKDSLKAYNRFVEITYLKRAK